MIDAIAILELERNVGLDRATAAKNLAGLLLQKAKLSGPMMLVDDDVRREFEYGAMLLGQRASKWYDEAESRFVRPVPE